MHYNIPSNSFSSCAGKFLKCALLKKSNFVSKKDMNFMCGIVLLECTHTCAHLKGNTGALNSVRVGTIFQRKLKQIFKLMIDFLEDQS